MKRFPYLSLALALALSCGGIGEAKQPKKPKLTNAQKRIWTRTDGVVTSTVPPIDLSTGRTAGHAASTFVSGVKTSALSDSIPNMGCPVQQIPLRTETVVAQGTASAPAGTNVNWEFTPYGSVAVQIGGRRQGLFNAYIGAANPNCVDFDSCKTTLTPVLIANVSEGVFDTSVPFVLDAPNLAPTDTAVFFITLTTLPTTVPPPVGDSWCSNAMFVPLAHSITPQ